MTELSDKDNFKRMPSIKFPSIQNRKEFFAKKIEKVFCQLNFCFVLFIFHI